MTHIEKIGTATLYLGDCRDTLASLPENSADSIVADAPYELDFMGRAWDRTGIAFEVAMWKAALRVLKPGGYLLAFSHARTYHRMTCAIEDAGFEIRDQIMWIYGSGFPKSRNLQGDREGWGTALKPAHEPIVMARKPLIGTVSRNVESHGTGAINIAGCRVPTDEVLRAGAGAMPVRHDPEVPRGKPGARYSAEQRGSLDEFKRLPQNVGTNPAGRWPANVVHDGSDEVVSAFPVAPGQQGDLKQQGHAVPQGNAFGQFGPKGPHAARKDSGTAARFFYCAKASKADRDSGMDAFEPKAFVAFQTANGTSGKASSISEGRDTQYRNTHPTVKPTDLMRWLVRLVTPPGGVVLDPFMGSGSTGRAAMLEGFEFIGCELTAEYLPIAAARIKAAQDEAEQASRQGNLFIGSAA
jgi:site-specific DNA-methyltransferase (adenine-specific)